MGVETKGDGGSNGKQSNSVPDESVIHPLPDKAVKSEETPRPTPSPTDKPSAKPTEKKKEGKAVDRFDTNEEDNTLHNLEWIRDRMLYWKRGIAKHEGSGPKAHSGQYMTFWSDCGGFNNIRMG